MLIATAITIMFGGQVWQDDGGEIHAYTGRLFAKDSDEGATGDGSNDLSFDHHGPNAARAAGKSSHP